MYVLQIVYQKDVIRSLQYLEHRSVLFKAAVRLSKIG